jgi:hypothetical protein
MGNEFQWYRQMRELGGAVEPARDLWPAIVARIARPAATTPRGWRSWRRRAFALGLLIAVGAGFAIYCLNRPMSMPADPKFAAATRELDQAGTELQAALRAHPHAVFLVGMLNRTHAQRMRLLRQAAVHR